MHTAVAFYDVGAAITFGKQALLSPSRGSPKPAVRFTRLVVPKVGGTVPSGAVGLPRWALIGTRGGRQRCYYHRGALVDK
jgi:hypothetical protein